MEMKKNQLAKDITDRIIEKYLDKLAVEIDEYSNKENLLSKE